MARAARVTITAGGRTFENGCGQEVIVSVTYMLDDGDPDVLTFVSEKAEEVDRAQEMVWRRITAGPEPRRPRR
jgi:hypothetical protein